MSNMFGPALELNMSRLLPHGVLLVVVVVLISLLRSKVR